MANNEINIKIGSRFDVTYELHTTTAPAEYDGFGTFTLYDSPTGRRFVAIQQRHKDWQINRYASGRHSAAPISDQSQIEWAENKLIEKLTKSHERTPATV